MSTPIRSWQRRDPITGDAFMAVPFRGRQLIDDPITNKGTMWPEAEREALGLTGLLPPHVATEEEQRARAWGNFQREATDVERYVMIESLHDRNETLYYQLLTEHTTELLPIVYTPTVGQACTHFHTLYRRPRGVYVDARNVDRTAELLRNAATHGDPDVIVVTDGERILGLGDLGTNGMGIPIGKLALYVAAGGFHPAATLPVVLDVGTDNERLLADPLYLGTRSRRLRGEAYERAVEAFVTGVQEAFPTTLLQFEDFAKDTAFKILARYRDRLCTFNDDIQGTGAVTLAAVMGALRITGERLADQRFLFVGAGSAGAGIADAIKSALIEDGGGPQEIFLRNSKGLVLRGRGFDAPREAFAQDPERIRALGVTRPDAPLAELIAELKPTVLIGTTGQARLFDEPIVRALAAGTPRPIVLPLSNPTSSCEADPQEVAEWSDGRALIATGSPFPNVRYDGAVRIVGQCNNVFIFPGVGLGVKVSGATRVTDRMFTAAARTLAAHTSDERLASEALLPAPSEIRRVSARVAAAVATEAVRAGLAPEPPAGTDWHAVAQAAMWEPKYLPYRHEDAY